MAVKVVCSQCNKDFVVSEAFSGSKVDCPQCKAVIILSIDVQAQTKQPIVKPVVKTFDSSDTSALQEQALSHLERWLDVPIIQLKNVLEMIDQNKAYTIWSIPKGNTNTFREITAPSETLKLIQRRILDRLLYRIPVANAAHGFIPSRSIVTNAQFHLKTAGSLLNLDLKDAFPSVNKLRVKHLYVRYLKIPLKHLGENVPHAVLNHVIDLLVNLTTHNNELPQGGPCSGYLLNLACITLDKSIYRLLAQYGEKYRYTRYADDITISSPVAIPQDIQDKVQKIVHDCGFQTNPRKCHYSIRSKGQQLEVTGLILEKDKVRIPREKLEVFRTIIHQAANTPPEQIPQEKRLEIQSIIAFIKMVYNKIPSRIWIQYKNYLEKCGLTYSKKTTKSYLNLYPNA